MHVTSDYYRNRELRPTHNMSLADRWTRAVRNAALAVERASEKRASGEGSSMEPLRPSACTLQHLAERYKS